MQIGHAGKNKGSNDTENLGGPAGLFVYPKTNELFVADGYFNHRVIVFDADTGAYKRHWGAYGKKPDDELQVPAARAADSGTAAAAVQQSRARGARVERRSRLRRRPHEQPAAGVQARRHVREGSVHRAGTRSRPKARCTTSRSRRTRSSGFSTSSTARTRRFAC